MQHARHSSRWFLTLAVALAGAAWLLGACAQPSSTPKSHRVGLLNSMGLPALTEEFKAGLQELGYVEGQNISYVIQDTGGDLQKLDAAAQAIADAKVDLVFATATGGAQAIQKVLTGTNTPIVFAAVTDPIAAGLVQSYEQPGGQVTGVTTSARGGAEHARRLELLLKLDPRIKQVYIPYTPSPAVAGPLATVQEAADKLGVTLLLQEIQKPEEALALFDAIPEEADAIFGMPSRGLSNEAVKKLMSVAQARRIPFSVSDGATASQGAVMGYGSEFPAMARQASRLADKILKGAPASQVPVETPEFFLTINLKEAQAIGLDIPDDLLQQAQTVIR
jgi:putative ABC transport system substrate-binding protein